MISIVIHGKDVSQMEEVKRQISLRSFDEPWEADVVITSVNDSPENLYGKGSSYLCVSLTPDYKHSVRVLEMCRVAAVLPIQVVHLDAFLEPGDGLSTEPARPNRGITMRSG